MERSADGTTSADQTNTSVVENLCSGEQALITDRIDAITRISKEYRGTFLPAPKSVKIELTATCNYKCSFCTKSLNNHEDGHMDKALYMRLIREMRDAGVEELGVFFIGESFTCKWLPDAIWEAKKVGFPYVFLTTNGSAATPDRVRQCMAAGLDSLKFSLNFHSPEQLADVAKVSPTYWRRSIENLKAAKTIRDAGDYSCKLYASSIKFDGEQGQAMQAVVEAARATQTAPLALLQKAGAITSAYQFHWQRFE